MKGWPGGDAWITSATLLSRKQWIDRVFRGADPPPMMMAAADASPAAGAAAPGEGRYRRMLERGMADYAFDPSKLPRDRSRLVSLVLAATPVNSIEGLEGAELVRALVSDPAYQLQ